MRLPVSIFVAFCLAAPAVASAQRPSWSAGGTVSAAWAGGWPVVDLVGFMAQLRYVSGTSIGLRVPLGARLLLRCELRYERSMTAYWTDRLGLSIGLEAIRGPRWGTANEERGM